LETSAQELNKERFVAVKEFKFKMSIRTITLQEKRENVIEARCSVGSVINNTSHFGLMEHHVPEVPAANN
jgi:hypothetical protein